MTQKAFIIGHPIAHSKSPIIHQYWLGENGIEGGYEPLDIDPKDLPAFFKQLKLGTYIGGNVTIPHKQDAIALCDEVTNEAQEIGAVNTIFVKNGRLFGSNTDILGFLANLDAKAPDWDKQGHSAIVLGAGGAARAILVALRDRGFKCVHVLNRTKQTATDLCAQISGPFQAHALEDFEKLAPEAHLLVNTTSIGMHGTKFTGMDLKRLPKSALVTDIVYTPLKTSLLEAAEAAGLHTVDGLGMLLHQAVPGFEAWFGHRPKVTPELRALVEKELGL